MKNVPKENNNFALIVVGVVAIVSIVGLLKLDGMTAKVSDSGSKSRILTESNEIVYCSSLDCKDSCGKECVGVKTRAGAGISNIYCAHNLFKEKKGTYYLHYFCGLFFFFFFFLF